MGGDRICCLWFSEKWKGEERGRSMTFEPLIRNLIHVHRGQEVTRGRASGSSRPTLSDNNTLDPQSPFTPSMTDRNLLTTILRQTPFQPLLVTAIIRSLLLIRTVHYEYPISQTSLSVTRNITSNLDRN